MSGKSKVNAYRMLIEELYRLKLGYDITFREILKYKYEDQQMSIAQIAKRFYVSTSTVHSWLREENITTRKLYY